MKNFGKELKKIKRLTKKDLKQFTPERVINDLNIIDELMNKMNSFDENITEKDVEKLKEELSQIESYLTNQYKDYVDLEDKDINYEDFEIDPKDFKKDLDTEE